MYSVSTTFRLGTLSTSLTMVMAALSSGLKRPELEADCSPPSSAGIKNFGALPLLPHTFSFHGVELIKLRESKLFFQWLF
jgi:hypothetical protein